MLKINLFLNEEKNWISRSKLDQNQISFQSIFFLYIPAILCDKQSFKGEIMSINLKKLANLKKIDSLFAIIIWFGILTIVFKIMWAQI
jgi:hypothetical protein